MDVLMGFAVLLAMILAAAAWFDHHRMGSHVSRLGRTIRGESPSTFAHYHCCGIVRVL